MIDRVGAGALARPVSLIHRGRARTHPPRAPRHLTRSLARGGAATVVAHFADARVWLTVKYGHEPDFLYWDLPNETLPRLIVLISIHTETS